MQEAKGDKANQGWKIHWKLLCAFEVKVFNKWLTKLFGLS